MVLESKVDVALQDDEEQETCFECSDATQCLDAEINPPNEKV